VICFIRCATWSARWPLPFARGARTLRYRDFITVALVLRDEGGLFDDNWIYTRHRCASGIQNFASWSPDMIPQPGFACLGLEYFCFEGDSLWDSSDAELIGLATREIEALGLVSKDQVVDGCVVRQPKAYPVYDEGYRGVVDAVRAEFRERYPTLHFVGRNGMHKYNNQDHSMLTAVLRSRTSSRVANVSISGASMKMPNTRGTRPDRAQAGGRTRVPRARRAEHGRSHGRTARAVSTARTRALNSGAARRQRPRQQLQLSVPSALRRRRPRGDARPAATHPWPPLSSSPQAVAQDRIGVPGVS
jgi:hypothetical protein